MLGYRGPRRRSIATQIFRYSGVVGRFTFVIALTVASLGIRSGAQQDDIGLRLLNDAAVRAALDAARDDEPRTLADQVRLCEIPAPPFKEGERARAYADAFRSLGL